ncbi:hypothetical protein HNQ77_003693 [Silvibacterium bohemicum]|uniref:Uncharacterized protein n=1 Tax=Silvibacterium bohemicum TaxID=1577686 RepID=A0A841JWH8_9BACT|nr:hypothetical protein [Silvibacterium bohemicum]MBB6145732.1 hypothetical protein [Silvibacterium bohemicum]
MRVRGCNILFVDQLAPRLMGLDVGDYRVGVAVSDPLGFTVQPVLTLESFLEARRGGVAE